MSFKTLNIDNLASLIEVLPPTLTANVGTDLWRRPPRTDISSAPLVYKPIPAKQFKRARVTITADWTRPYDQGGIVFILPGWPERKVWVKAGIEILEGKTVVSVVGGRDDASDCSLHPLTDKKTVTIEIERDSKNRSSLCVYKVEGRERSTIREMTWVFKENELDGEVGVGIYAARPKAGEGELAQEPLTVTFTDFEVVH